MIAHEGAMGFLEPTHSITLHWMGEPIKLDSICGSTFTSPGRLYGHIPYGRPFVHITVEPYFATTVDRFRACVSFGGAGHGGDTCKVGGLGVTQQGAVDAALAAMRRLSSQLVDEVLP